MRKYETMRTSSPKLLAGILIGLVVLALETNAQSRRSPKTQGRDLATYDNGGLLKANYENGPLERSVMKARLREFLWTHWTQKEKGRIRHSVPTIDTGPLVTSFFVEQDFTGKWIVTEIYTTCDCMLGHSGKQYFTISVYTDVQRVELITDSSESEIPKPIPPEVQRDPASYAIRLIAKDPADNFIF